VSARLWYWVNRDYRKPYLELDEEELILARADAIAADGLPGNNRKRLGVDGQMMCHKMAEGEVDPVKRQRLAGAKCSRDWVQRLLKNTDKNAVAAEGTMKKQSQVSRARAAAKNPVINAEMFAKIDKQYADHFAAGILKTRMPDSSQLYGGDEVGVNPSGHSGTQVFCSILRRQIVSVVDGEGGKATFWCTFFFWTRADGQFVIPPGVIHQSAHLSEYHCLELPEDWMVHTSPSGYMDRDGWLKVARHFQRFCGPTRPLYLYFDGHDSHWDPDALNEWFQDHIYPTFFKAHGSEDDNINDNGPNSAFHAAFDECTAHFGRTHPGVKDAVPFVNERLAATWRKIKATCGGVAVRAAEKTGLYPFNPNSATHCDGLDLISRKFTVATPWVNEVFSPDWDEAGGTKYKLITARKAAPNRGILVRAKAAEFVRETHVIPAQALDKVFREHKRAKKNKASIIWLTALALSLISPQVDGSVNRSNPDTTKGVVVAGDVLGEAYEVSCNRSVKNLATRASKVSAENKRAGMRSDRENAAENLGSLIDEHDRMNWNQLVGKNGLTTVKVLRSALEHLSGNVKYTKNMLKHDLICDFRERYQESRL
jgi:hypothetical protein